MEQIEKEAWDEVLKDLRDLQAEYEKELAEKTAHCGSKRAPAAPPKPLIDIER